MLVICVALLLARQACGAGTVQDAGEGEIKLTSALVIPSEGRRGRRTLLSRDALEHARITGKLATPKDDEVAPSSSRRRRWTTIKTDQDGWLKGRSLRGGYVYWAVERQTAGTMILEARGHSIAFVNGVPRAGDPYSTGWHQLPVPLKAGRNDILFHVGRGRLRAKLVEPADHLMLSGRDATLPDLIAGESRAVWCALMVINASGQHRRNLSLVARLEGGKTLRTPLASQLPWSVRKVPFQCWSNARPGDTEKLVDLSIVADNKPEQSLARYQVKIPVSAADRAHRRTFVSDIDGSVQYYAVQPAEPSKSGEPTRPDGLLLTLHGAGVPADRQARVYSRKTGLHVVAPTNRRPFGFDWEDWGRLDALEVLGRAQRSLKTDARRTYLTGHSMGGHGTWHLGVTHPDLFAAIAPSAGWVSFWSYGGKPRPVATEPRLELMQRASNTSDTLQASRNLRSLGIYVLHGDADNNVPVSQARTMRGRLAAFHPNFVYKEQPGAGHWWGNRCCDWPPLIRFLQTHLRPDNSSVSQLEFRTANPATSHRFRWASIESQLQPLKWSSIELSLSKQRSQLTGRTENVARLRLSLKQLADQPIQIELDDQRIGELRVPAKGDLILVREQGRWDTSTAAAPALKGPHRSGPFKQAFRHRVLFIYGTKGNEAENRWAIDKARFDAEVFWYRGNSAIEILADSEYDATTTADRSVVLYGNATTNSAWTRLLADSPIHAERDRLRIGQTELTGADLGFYFVRPRRGSDSAMVAVVGGTGLVGMRSTTRSRYFVSGVGYPDFLIHRADRFARLDKAVEAVGYFGNDWRLSALDTYPPMSAAKSNR